MPANPKKLKTTRDKNLEAQRPAIGIMCVPFTWVSELAKDVRCIEQKMNDIIGWQFKVVKRSRDKAGQGKG